MEKSIEHELDVDEKYLLYIEAIIEMTFRSLLETDISQCW